MSKDPEKDAWLVYEYRARKRLYEQFDPLWFQFIELSEIAIRRIRALGREAKDGRSHYSDIDSYEMANAIYRLLALLAAFRLMEQY